MRTIPLLFAGVLPILAVAAPAHFDVGDAHVIVIRPIDSWDPNKTTAEYSLDGLRAKIFNFQYIDAAGANITPRPGGLFHDKVATPLSDEVLKIMTANGFSNKGSHVFFVSRAVKLEPAHMNDFVKAQNLLYRTAVAQQGDPATLKSRIAAKNAVSLFATMAVAGFGIDKLGHDAVNLSQYSTLYADISKLSGGASVAVLPLPLPDYDYSGFTEIDVRRVTDNARHVGEILIAYRGPKSAASEQSALAQAIAAAGGVGTTEQEVEAARAKDYEQRLTIWTECQATPGCAQQ
jgi:hypothetical protein